MYGHVITKFSGMGRFTYPAWCSAGARFPRAKAPLLEMRSYFTLVYTCFCIVCAFGAILSETRLIYHIPNRPNLKTQERSAGI